MLQSDDCLSGSFGNSSFSKKTTLPYPQAGKRHRFAILVPPGSTPSPLPHYPEELYQVFTYEDLTEAIAALNENDFDGVVVLGETTRIEPAFLEEINSVFDAGIQAIQLRHITEKRSTRKQYFQALNEEITQALFGTGATRLESVVGFIRCGHGIGLEMAEKESKEPQEQSGKKISPARYFRGISGKSESL